MKLVASAVRKPVTTLILYVSVAVLGSVSLRELSIDLLPDIRYPKLSVAAYFPGAAPEDMEALVTAPLEAAFSGIPNLSEIESASREGTSFITLEFPWGGDMDFARLHAREKIDGIRDTLPEGLRGPLVSSLDPGDKPIMVLAVCGDRSLIELKELSEELIKPRLEQAAGIASADIAGGIERQIQVDVDPVRLSEFELNLEDIAACIGSWNTDLWGGSLRKGQVRHSLRVSGGLENISQIAEIRLKAGEGSVPVRLRDVAVVRNAVKERQGMTRLNGREAIGIMVRKEPGANTVAATECAKKEIAGMIAENPGLSIRVVSEQSRTIEAAVAAAKGEIAGGGVLAFLVLLLFLHEIRTPLIIGAVIPISILATFNLLFLLNVTLNLMSLGGLALGVGMLDDCAVVVSESIFRRRRGGQDASQAAVEGAAEVGPAVTGAALTTVVVFLPVIYVPGPAGQLFKDAALTVTCSLLASLVVSLTLLPMLLSRRFSPSRSKDSRDSPSPGRKTPEGAGKRARFIRSLKVRVLGRIRALNFDRTSGPSVITQKTPLRSLARLFRPVEAGAKRSLRGAGRKFDAAYQKLVTCYIRALDWSLMNKGKVVLMSALYFGLTALIAVGFDREFLPKMRPLSFELLLNTPQDYSLEQTSAVAASIEQDLSRMPEARLVHSLVGVVSGMEASNPESSLNSVRIHVEGSGPRETGKIIDGLGRILNRFPETRYSIVSGRSMLEEYMTFGSRGISYRVRGAGLLELQETASRLSAVIAEIPGIFDVHADFEPGSLEVIARVRTEALAAYPGLSVARIGSFFVNGLRGKIANGLREMEQRTDVLVRLDPAAAPELESLLNVRLPVRGASVPLRELVRCQFNRGPREIRRTNQQREIAVRATLRGLKARRALHDINDRIRRIPMPPDCRIIPGGEQEEMRRSFRSLIIAFFLALLLNYLIMAAQFESLRHPFIILSTIPMGLSGSIWVMRATGQTLNAISLIGIIILLGIIVDNAIVKIDCANKLREQGAKLRQAIVEASHVRLRPILMSTLTTLAGLIPMSLGLGRGSDLLRPLGIVVAGGLAFSTFLTLFLIPVIYEAVEEKRTGR